jgi:ribosomal protein S12 methylthiotransferase
MRVSASPAICFQTLGCPKNEVDSDRMRAAISASSLRVTDDLAEADVAVLNTCAFISDAVEEAVSVILELAEWKALRDGRRIVVTGCLPSRYSESLSAELPEVDAFVPVADEGTLLAVVTDLTGAAAESAQDNVGRTIPGPTAYLQVSDGCHRTCAYCTIPAIRGPYVSAPLDRIREEARFLVGAGARELVLIGQDISAYGRDLEGPLGLPGVLEAIAGLPGEFRVRLMYVQPDGVTPALLATIAAHDNVCRYLDIPLQHASRDVLRRMGRSGDATSFLRLIERIRALLPDVALRTTMMAGFPGETRDDIRILERFLREAAFDYVGVFAFSPEEGTKAADMPDQVPKRTRLARAQRLRDMADEVGFERAAARIGDTVRVLIEGLDEPGQSTGRSDGQAPEIDGEVVLSGELVPGSFVMTRIIDSIGYDLVGEVTA